MQNSRKLIFLVLILKDSVLADKEKLNESLMQMIQAWSSWLDNIVVLEKNSIAAKT